MSNKLAITLFYERDSIACNANPFKNSMKFRPDARYIIFYTITFNF